MRFSGAWNNSEERAAKLPGFHTPHRNRNLAIRRAVGWMVWHRRGRNKSKSVFFHLALEIKTKSSLCNEWIDSCEIGLAQLQSLFKHSPRPQLREGK